MDPVRNEIALIAPPFSASPSPYISLPTLMGWLKEEGITTRFVDLARDLEAALLSPARISAAYDHIGQTFLALNGREKLPPSQAIHIAEVQMLLKALAPVYRDWEQDDFRRAERNLLLELVSAPHWPQCLKANDGLQLRSQYNLYSSHDLLCSGKDSFFFTAELRQLIDRQIDGERTLVAGIAIVFDQQVIPALQCARIIKELFPAIHVTLGGPFVTIHMRDLENREFFAYVDSLIVDEGEGPLVALHQALLAEKPALEEVPNLVWCNDQGRVRRNASAPFIDLARIPPPDYGHCGLDRYPESDNMRLTVRLSKGCYWRRCAFCRVGLSICRNYSQPDVDTVYRGLCEVIDTTGVSNYLFSDESCAPEILEKVAERLLAEGRKITWTFHTRIDRARLTRERVEKFRQAGCSGFVVGIETFNDRLLQLLNKGITEEEIEFVLRDLKGILPLNAYMMVGLPTETEAEYCRSLQAVERFKQEGLLEEYQYSLFNLAAGSLMWKHPERYGITKVEGLDGADLMANNVTNFEAAGMSRLTAFGQYLKVMSRKMPAKIHEMPIEIQGEKHFCRYNPKILVEAMGELFIKKLDIPFVTWLGQADQACGPVQGQDPWWMIYG